MGRYEDKSAGILMPVASLPSEDGIGNFGKTAYEFIDRLEQMGVGIWQILPLNPLGYGNSPYQPYSSFAGDEIYIALERLVEMNLLDEAELTSSRKTFRETAGIDTTTIDYQKTRTYKEKMFLKAFANFKKQSSDEKADYEIFAKQAWVYNYAVFIALKKQNNLRCWNEWPKEQQDWILDHKYDITHLEEEIAYQMFLQYMFYKQWMELKTYANKKQIKIMGDIPFYVGIDSLDVWSERENFLLDADAKPAFVAGVPPDYFSATGQRWGNPIYNWSNLQKKGFVFWTERLKYSSVLYDILRLDHFRAFDTYWKIPATCETAIEGEWIEAPGYLVFDEIYKQMPDIQIVAEDLGDLRPEVLELRDHYKLLGMYVAEFSIDSDTLPARHQLIYAGTHDNQTIMGWYKEQSKDAKVRIRRKLRGYGKPWDSVAKKMVEYVYCSPCEMAIVALADVIGLGDEARLNTPGTVGSPNWEWKLKDWVALDNEIPRIRRVLKK